jgi:DNA-binding NarL/FixJ family response regulator
VSAREETPNRDRARRAGASGYFQKPVDAETLASGIRRVLAGEGLWGSVEP